MTPPEKPQQQPQEEDKSKKAMELQFPVKVEVPLWSWHIQDDSCYSPEAFQHSAETTDPSVLAPEAPQHSAGAIFYEAPQASGCRGTNLISEPVSSVDYQLQDFGTRQEHKPPTTFETTSRNTSMPWDDHDSNTKRTETKVQPRSQKAQTSSMYNNTSATNVDIIDLDESPTENEVQLTSQKDHTSSMDSNISVLDAIIDIPDSPSENKVQPRSQNAQTSSMYNKTSATNVVIIDSNDSPTENEVQLTSPKDHTSSMDSNISVMDAIIDIPDSPPKNKADIGETLQPYQRQLAHDIRKINQELKMIKLEVVSPHEPGKGTVVRCTYQWEGFNDTHSIWTISAVTYPSDFSVDFVIPTDYPRSLPQIIKDFKKQKIICSKKEIKDALKSARLWYCHDCQGQVSLRELALVWGISIQYFCK